MLYTQQKGTDSGHFWCVWSPCWCPFNHKAIKEYRCQQTSTHPHTKRKPVSCDRLCIHPVPFNTSQCFQLMQKKKVSVPVQCVISGFRVLLVRPRPRCVREEEEAAQGALSISCLPAGEPLLPVTSSRQPVCLFNPPRVRAPMDDCWVKNKNKRVLTNK